MDSVAETVNSIINEWNKNVKAQGIESVYELNCNVRVKKSYVNRKDYYENKIAEIVLLHKGKPCDLMLWRKQLIMPPKVAKTPTHQVEAAYISSLYKHFLYECIGNFTICTKQLITNQDYAEYDIVNDRLKQHESAVDMIVQCTTDGPFFTKGDEFDVFMVTDNYYAVYTQHDEGLKNNGIARLKKEDCLITQNAKVKIILDY